MPNAIHLNQTSSPQRISSYPEQEKISKPRISKSGVSKSGSNPNASGDQAQLKKACTELESVFIYHLLKEMRATIPNSGLMGGEGVKDMYNHMTDSHLARELSNDGGIGLSNILYRQLNKLTVAAGNDNNEKID